MEDSNTETDETSPPASEVFDITIVGGGPVGLFGAFYAGMRQMKTKILESLPELGGQLAALYPEKYIFDMPGFPRVLAQDLAVEMAKQGTRFAPKVCCSEKVLQLQRQPEDETWRLITNRAEHVTRTVVLTLGGGAFAPKRLDTPGVTELEGRGVYYFVRDIAQFAGKRLLIVGGGDSALDWAMHLEPVAKSISLIHRRDVFRAHEESVDWLLNRSRVDVRLWHELRRVEGNGHLERAVVMHNQTREEAVLEVDGVLLHIGFSMDIGPARDWGVEMEGSSILVNHMMETNLPGVYAAGDVAQFEGKIKLIATGVGEVCTAVNYAKHRIDPHSKVFPGHSTNMDL
ncbi:MAG: NAD(P)/FAD-dependent oxidoreductase [Armatimonadetes bacterium]|nr:NAD(P)/FAD-dependent oxidoreductase [Armatimonadota bacterium]MDE2207661.1 NAD(P)/FAD-dependent oxidoreductase [Armatimonadota bacterium]